MRPRTAAGLPAEIRGAEAILRDTLRQSRAAAPQAHTDARLQREEKDMLSREHDRSQACARILRVQRYQFERGAAQSVLEQFWLTGLAITRAWFAERASTAPDPSTLSPSARRARLVELHAAEERAQGEREVAEVGLHEGSDAAVARFIEAQTSYAIADQALADFVRAIDVVRRGAGRVVLAPRRASAFAK